MNTLVPFNRNALERHWEQNSHSCKDVHDKNPYKKNMDSHLYKAVHNENQNKKNLDSVLYIDVHDENPQ